MREKNWTVIIELFNPKTNKFRVWKRKTLKSGFELCEFFHGFRIVGLHSYGISRTIKVRLLKEVK